jgi:ketosteroid isomerase-like protein
MKGNTSRFIILIAATLVLFAGSAAAQRTRERSAGTVCEPGTGLNGLYRIDFENSDQLYSVIEGASSNLPFADQQQFFMDLAIRLTPPDLLAIECRAGRVALASSRAAKVEFNADGVARSARQTGGAVTRSRISLDRSGLTFTSSGGNDDLNFNFTPIDGGRRLRVTRRIAARELIEPVVIRTIYQKIADVARWDIFEDEQVADRDEPSARRPEATPPTRPPAARARSNQAEILRSALASWIEATNRRDIDRQLSFYMPRLKAFYLTRNASLASVRSEKRRAFAAARSIDIRAAEPEIVFQNGGQEAVMRFRKKYQIQNPKANRSGEVVQELRWQRTGDGWKIFSERDIKVIR